MQYLNANTIHNVLNAVMVLLGAATAGLTASGCTQGATGVIDCSHSFINPTYAGYAIAAIGLLKFVMNIGRDGLTGLVKPQPPVQK